MVSKKCMAKRSSSFCGGRIENPKALAGSGASFPPGVGLGASFPLGVEAGEPPPFGGTFGCAGVPLTFGVSFGCGDIPPFGASLSEIAPSIASLNVSLMLLHAVKPNASTTAKIIVINLFIILTPFFPIH
jgi:hypothetical protein